MCLHNLNYLWRGQCYYLIMPPGEGLRFCSTQLYSVVEAGRLPWNHQLQYSCIHSSILGGKMSWFKNSAFRNISAIWKGLTSAPVSSSIWISKGQVISSDVLLFMSNIGPTRSAKHRTKNVSGRRKINIYLQKQKNLPDVHGVIEDNSIWLQWWLPWQLHSDTRQLFYCEQLWRRTGSYKMREYLVKVLCFPR